MQAVLELEVIYDPELNVFGLKNRETDVFIVLPKEMVEGTQKLIDAG